MMNYSESPRNKAKRDEQAPETIVAPPGMFSNGWLIAAVFLLVSALGVMYTFTRTPLYEGSMLIQIKRSASMSGEVQGEAPVTTAMEILRSRSILSRVVERLQLDVSAEPKRLPVIGSLLNAAETMKTGAGRSGTTGSPGEPLQVTVFEVPPSLLNAPFIVEVESANSFTISLADPVLRIDGTVGRMASVSTSQGRVAVLIGGLNARPGSRFVLRRVSAAQAVNQLQRSLVVAENGKQSNVIRVALQGTKPQLLSRILDEIGNEFLRQRIAERTDETATVKDLYDQALGKANQRQRELESRYDRTLRRIGTANPEEESRTLSQQQLALQAKLTDIAQRKLELSSRYLGAHPVIEGLNQQIEGLNRDLAQVEARRRALAAAERDLSIINHDKQLNGEINVGLLNARSKLDMLMPPEHGDVRLVDRAGTPIQATTLGVPAMIALSCLAGLILGVFASVLKNAITRKSSMRIVPQNERRFRLISMARTEVSRRI